MENGDRSSSSDSESSDQSDEVDEGHPKNRQTRDLAWCGVDDNEQPPRVIWPPTAQAGPSGGNNWRNLRPVRLGNPLYGTKMQLYSQSRLFLALYPDGTVRGTADENDLHTYLELSSANHGGHVRIKGLLTKLYVSMTKKGGLHGVYDNMEEDTVFVESFQGSYNSYLSRKYAHLGWYIGIKKNGKIKLGPKTKYGQKAIKFLPIRSKFE